MASVRLRKTKKGEQRYHLSFRSKVVKGNISFHTQELADSFIECAKQNPHRAQLMLRRISFEALGHEFILANLDVNPREISRFHKVIELATPLFGATPIGQIRRRHAKNFQRCMASSTSRYGKPFANATINQYMFAAKKMFDFAVHRGYLLDNPFEAIPKLKDTWEMTKGKQHRHKAYLEQRYGGVPDDIARNAIQLREALARGRPIHG